MENQFDDKQEELETENEKPLMPEEIGQAEKTESVEPEETQKEDTVSPIERPYQRWQHNQEQQKETRQADSYEYTQYQGTGQSQYQQNAYDQNQMYQGTRGENDREEKPMSMGDWLLVLIAGAIPCVGQILYIVWAFSQNGNENRRNYCRAALILMVVVFVLYMIFGAIFAVGFSTALN